ncbi:hypothetical protein [uncultured Nitrosomonas sp.]|uniref:hypothetical protein n=1 Tax=uncultured Nitrosomonas sp. TaxID=156424 RepID=UPI0025EA1EF6|nr:hypothetical protein [uncultured Nitrosomonas sp.]
MIDITPHILVWLACCKEVWGNWYKKLDNGEDEFGEVEQALFSSLVLSSINMVNRPDLDKCYKLLFAVYKADVEDYRSVCTKQKSGNIYCESKVIKFDKDTVLPIKAIDSIGTMQEGKPYVELKINEHEYILESIDNLSIKINI